jgi:hypothetical protein
MSVELKVKYKSLAEEARIIRKEENKLRNMILWAKANSNDFEELAKMRSKRASLSDHRKKDVRNENRATQLARAFLSGVPYISVEQKRNESKEYHFQTQILKRVLTMANKYGDKQYDMSDVKLWINA